MTQGKNGQERNWFGYLTLLGLMIILLLIARATWSLYRKNQIARENLRFSIARVEKLTEHGSGLRDKIERLKTARGVEEEIRNNFPVVKAGERVINLVEEKPVTTTVATTTRRWWQIFSF